MNNHQALGINDSIHDKVAIQKKLNVFRWFCMFNPVKLNPERNYYIQLSDKALQFQKKYILYYIRCFLNKTTTKELCSKHVLNCRYTKLLLNSDAHI